MSNNLQSTPKVKPWYNRPLFGNKSLLERILSIFNKPNVPSDVISMYEDTLMKMDEFAKMAQQLDLAKFSNPEFLFYVKINLMLMRSGGGMNIVV